MKNRTKKTPGKPPAKKAAKKAPKKRGRPSQFREAQAAEICRRLSTGEPLAAICRDAGMPQPNRVRDWTKTRLEFAEAYTVARENGFDALAAECLTIADDATGDVIESEYGGRVDSGVIHRAKLRIDTRLKLLSKWDPKRYGEKIEVEQTGPPQTYTVVIGPARDDAGK